MSPLPAPGSMQAHEQFVEAFINWRLKQQACDALPMVALEAAKADEAWALMKAHAVNCGWEPTGPDPLTAWAPRRIRSYGKSIGVSELEIAVVVGPDEACASTSSNSRKAA